MSYNGKIINDIIISAVATLREQQPMLFSAADDVNERAVSAALQSLIAPSFPDYIVNCEYNRMTDENGIQIPKRIYLNPYNANPSLVYPDIIVHHQNDGDHNLLVIEIKMQWKNADRDTDLNKLRGYTSELNYSHGLYLELGENEISDMTWFQNGEQI